MSPVTAQDRYLAATAARSGTLSPVEAVALIRTGSSFTGDPLHMSRAVRGVSAALHRSLPSEVRASAAWADTAVRMLDTDGDQTHERERADDVLEWAKQALTRVSGRMPAPTARVFTALVYPGGDPTGAERAAYDRAAYDRVAARSAHPTGAGGQEAAWNVAVSGSVAEYARLTRSSRAARSARWLSSRVAAHPEDAINVHVGSAVRTAVGIGAWVRLLPPEDLMELWCPGDVVRLVHRMCSVGQPHGDRARDMRAARR
jgi:hypothetical protein